MSINQTTELDPLELALISIQDKSVISNLGEVKVPDTYVGVTQQLHPNGLYSTDTFGLKGTPMRMSTLGYISLNSKILIPDVYKQLSKARTLYVDIMRGAKYAIYDKVINDFVETSLVDGGETGYSFFIRNVDTLIPSDSGTSTRNRLINFLNVNKNKLTTKYLLVAPAGFRDIEQTQDGRVESDDINSLYLAVLRFSSFISTESPAYDNFRYQTQLAVNAVSDYIDKMLFGKSGLFNSKYSKRSVRQGTRNVLTSQINDVKHLDDPSNLLPLDSTVGLIQCMSMYPDLLHYHIKQLLAEVMPDIGYDFTGIDPNTFKSTQIKFDGDIYGLFKTTNGFAQLIKILKIRENRTKIMQLNGKWLGALYKPQGKVQLVSDISHIDNFNPEHLHPITLSELIYLAMMEVEARLVGTSTRPPVLGQGGISQTHFRPYLSDPFEYRDNLTTGSVGVRYPTMRYTYEQTKLSTQGDSKSSTVYANTTGKHMQNNLSMSNMLGWYGQQKVSLAGAWNDSFTVSELKLKSYSGDFDGDCLTAMGSTTNEAVAEITNSFRDAATYIDANGNFVYSLGSVDVANNILATLTA